jgi:hypothetical protein
MARTATTIIAELTDLGRPPRLTATRPFAGFLPALPPRGGPGSEGELRDGLARSGVIGREEGETGELRGVPSCRGEALWL